MFLVALTLCTFASCEVYHIASDTEWKTQAECMPTLIKESERFANVWGHSMPGVSKYLARFNITTNPQTLTDYDYTCEFVAMNDIP